ncbi:hypothetical protein [Actinophytocola sp.]|uniref:hypothetical protein n=1 Tax=Actinophytocola sp. TaxID=1872138 RepID=UPI00389AF63C
MPEHSRHTPGDAARISEAIPPEANTDHKWLTLAAAAYLMAYIEEHGNNQETTARRALRENFLEGREMCRAGATRNTRPGAAAVADVLDEDVDRLYVLAADVSQEQLNAALAEAAAAVGLNTYSSQEINTLDGLLAALYSVSADLANRVLTYARPLTADEWNGLGSFFIRGLILIGNPGGLDPAPHDTDKSTHEGIDNGR